jgi:Rad3-related DNA helicase
MTTRTTDPFGRPIIVNPFKPPFEPTDPSQIPLLNVLAPAIAVPSVKSPIFLGLPFPKWRTGQHELYEQFMEFVYNSDKKILMVEGPPGIGKSLVAAITALALTNKDPGFDTVITTARVALQEQYVNETFKHHVAKAAWGRNKHDCLIMDNLTVDQAPCQGGYNCKQKDECPYFVERDTALASKVAVLNTMFWLTLANFGHDIVGASGRRLAIHDEAHFLEPTIRSLVTASLNVSFWKRSQGLSWPQGDSIAEWRDWLLQHHPMIKAKAADARKQIRGGTSPEGFKSTLKAEEAFMKIMDFILPSNPLITRTKYGVKFEPIWGNDFADTMLWDKADKHILMSATLNHEYVAGTLNLKREDYEVIELPSPFHHMRRRIMFDPVVKVNAKTTRAEFQKLINRMDDILDEQLQRENRGIIHSVSYRRAEDVIAMSRHSSRMFTHRAGDVKGKEEAIDELLGSDDGILVSPSVGVGEDFGRGDNVRFQIFVKYPIPYMGDPVIKARVNDWSDSLWFEADQAFVQAVGRGTRSEDDWCINYVLDAGAGWRFKYLPEYVQESIVYPPD